MSVNSFRKMTRKIEGYAKLWERQGYPEGIPDEAPAELEGAGKVPSWRRICKAILKNDLTLQTLGYSRPECSIYNQLKRKELRERGVIGKPVFQYELFGGKHECL